MTRTPQEVADAASAAADEEMLAALERAGIDMWQLGRLSTDDGLFVIERDDLNQELVFLMNELARLSTDDGLFVVERDDLNQELLFQSSPSWGRDRIIWRWRIWGSSDPHSLSRVRLFDLGGGWEPDVASMVARVVAFLGMGKP